MSTTVTQDIKVSVHSWFEASRSDPRFRIFIFGYRITITNNGRDAVKLQHRHWSIRDSQARTRQVDSTGVVGETPTLLPGSSFAYTSSCDLRSGFGRMDGWYGMLRIPTGEEFEVRIPEIQLAFPFAAN